MKSEIITLFLAFISIIIIIILIIKMIKIYKKTKQKIKEICSPATEFIKDIKEEYLHIRYDVYIYTLFSSQENIIKSINNATAKLTQVKEEEIKKYGDFLTEDDIFNILTNNKIEKKEISNSEKLYYEINESIDNFSSNLKKINIFIDLCKNKIINNDVFPERYENLIERRNKLINEFEEAKNNYNIAKERFIDLTNSILLSL